MKRLSLVPALLFLLAAPAALRADPAIDSAFGDALLPVKNRDGQPSAQFGGVFPEGWMEDSSNWTRVAVDCAPGQEDGQRYLRITTREVAETGKVQFCHLLPAAAQETFYRLRMRVRVWNWNGPAGRIGIRHLHSPWDFVWTATLPTSSNWTDIDARFELKPEKADAGLFIEATSPGSKIDVAYVKLEEVPEAKLRADADAAYPGHGPANLFRNSRFPLGIQQGWMIKREVSDRGEPGPVEPPPGGTWGNGTIRALPDPANPGPSGAPALRIESVDGRGVTLASEPFLPVYPFVDHAVSFYAKGDGKWTCRVRADGAVLAEKAVTPGADWTRVTIPFTPRKIADGYRLEFLGIRPLWIDGLQAGPAEKAGAYASAGACEAALGLPKSDASDARIQFADEPARVVCEVTGETAAGRLKAEVADLYGGRTALLDVPVTPGTPLSVDFSAALKKRPYGAFRVEAWVEEGGKRISPVNELVVNRLPRPRYWGKDAPDSPFGVHVAAATRNVLMAKAVGINWVRLHDVTYTWWEAMEPEKGKWLFFDGEIALYRRLGMKLLGEFGSAPKWASYYADTGKTTWDNTWDRWFQPKSLADYANYVTTVAARYKGVIDDWDVWNEPWVYPFWSKGYDASKTTGLDGYLPGPHAAADYAELGKTAYAAARAANPAANVLGFNTTGHGPNQVRFGGTEWTTGVLKAGGLGACDTLCYHDYESTLTGFPGDALEAALATAFGPVREAQGGTLPKPVWMTEGSPLSSVLTGFGLARLSAFGTEGDDCDVLSDRLARYMLGLASRGVSKWFLYAMSQYEGRVVPTYVILLTPDGYLHPSGIAHAAFARLIEGAKFVRVREAAPGVYASLFREGDRAVVAVTSREPDAAFRLPAVKGAEVSDLYGNPLPADAAFAGKIVYLSARGEAADRLEAALAPKP